MIGKENDKQILDDKSRDMEASYRLCVTLLTDALILERRKKAIEYIINQALDERDDRTFYTYATHYSELLQ